MLPNTTKPLIQDLLSPTADSLCNSGPLCQRSVSGDQRVVSTSSKRFKDQEQICRRRVKNKEWKNNSLLCLHVPGNNSENPSRVSGSGAITRNDETGFCIGIEEHNILTNFCDLFRSSLP